MFLLVLISIEISVARGIKRIKRNPSDGQEAKSSKQAGEEFSLSNADKTISKKDNSQQGEQQNNQMEHHEHSSNGPHGNEVSSIYDKVRSGTLPPDSNSYLINPSFSLNASNVYADAG